MTHLWAAKAFNELVIGSGTLKGEILYVFNGAGLELLHHVKRLSFTTLVEQTSAPRFVRERLLEVERWDFPHWEQADLYSVAVQEFAERETKEWALADKVICPSKFVRDTIVQSGGPADRCFVVPYGVDLPRIQKRDRRVSRPLRVLTVGTVELLKGSPYVVQAAKCLQGTAHIRMVGGFAANPQVLPEIQKWVDYRGLVPRNEIAEHYRWADVFLLPSICEGSATVTYEALSYGLPVICTSNTGSLVRHGENGFIVAMRSSQAIVDAIERLASSGGLVERLSETAWETRNAVSLGAYEDRLVDVLS
jgi:glycosyltransferase involved in cell wall biosynthesis